MDENILRQMQRQTETDQQKTLMRCAAETLDRSQQTKLRALLSDPDAVHALLQSERAQTLLRQIKKDERNKNMDVN